MDLLFRVKSCTDVKILKFFVPNSMILYKRKFVKIRIKKKNLQEIARFPKKNMSPFFCLSISLMAEFGLIDLPMITALATSQN